MCASRPIVDRAPKTSHSLGQRFLSKDKKVTIIKEDVNLAGSLRRHGELLWFSSTRKAFNTLHGNVQMVFSTTKVRGYASFMLKIERATLRLNIIGSHSFPLLLYRKKIR
jgi:hypothetical protein